VCNRGGVIPVEAKANTNSHGLHHRHNKIVLLNKSKLVHVNSLTDDSLVKQKDVSTHADTGNSKDPGPDGSSGLLSLHLREGIVGAWKHFVDKLAATGVWVSKSIDALFALGRLLVKVFANISDSVFVLVVVVVVVSVVVVTVLVVVVFVSRGITTGNASRGDKGFSWKTGSVVVLFVGSRGGFLGTGRILESSSENTLGSTVSTDVVGLVVAVVVTVVVVVVVVVVVLSSFLFVHGTAFTNVIHGLLFVVILHTVAHGLGSQTGVLASFVIITVVLVVSVLALVLARLDSVLAGLFVLHLLGFLVGFNEFLHVDNIFTSVPAVTTRVRWAKLELGQKVGAESLFAFKAGNLDTSIELDGVVLHPRGGVSVLVVLVQSTSIGHDLLSHRGLGGDVSFKVDIQGGDSGEQKSESRELHCVLMDVQLLILGNCE